MKDELGGAVMTEIITLRPKLYSFKKLDGLEDKKCKGIKKCVVKKTLSFEDYKNCICQSSIVYRSQFMFRSIKHQVYTLKVYKVALSDKDDNRIIKKDGLITLARGHRSLCWSLILGKVSLS